VTVQALTPGPVHAHGAAILRAVGINPALGIEGLATRIVPAGPTPFRGRLLHGLRLLLAAVADRNAGQAAWASELLLGVGPGSTPLGDDYLAASSLTVRTVGPRAGLGAGEAADLSEAILPPRARALTPASARMFDAVRDGRLPQRVTGIYRLEVDAGELIDLVVGIAALGASSGRAWSATIGATALLLEPQPNEGATH